VTSIVVITLGLLVFIAHGLEEVFTRTKMPDVLILLSIGLLLGPVTGLVSPERMGVVGPVFTTMTLVVILFVGGLGLDFKVLVKSFVGASGLTIWNFIGSMAVVAPIVKFSLGFDWLQAFTMGATLGGINTALVIPIVKRLALKEKTKTMLTLESALSDVAVIVVALGLIEAQMLEKFEIGHLFGGMFASFAVAAVVGGLAGTFWAFALKRLQSLKKSIFTTPAFVLVIFGMVEYMGHSGAIAALMIGVTLGNIKALPPYFLRKYRDRLASPNDTELAVFEEVAFLLKTFFFVYIGFSIQLTNMSLILAGLGTAVALFLIRIPVVHASFFPSKSFTRFEASLTGALNPKGLSAAVVASIPIQRGLEKASEMQLIVFAVVLFSTFIASLLVFLIERGWFGSVSKIIYGRFPIETEEIGFNPPKDGVSNKR
jgi:NhaP-type Na+/H+ or K+/H+ antiporter